jgi:hypothetical protein
MIHLLHDLSVRLQAIVIAIVRPELVRRLNVLQFAFRVLKLWQIVYLKLSWKESLFQFLLNLFGCL